MDKQKVFEHFSHVLDNLIDSSAYFKTYLQYPSLMEFDIEGHRYPELDSNIDIYSGCTRTCIIDEQYDYVVKFDTDTDDWGGSICEREAEIYRDACEYGVADCFNEIVYVGTYTRTINFYDAEIIYRYCPSYWSYVSFMDEYRDCDESKFGEIIPITISVPLFACPRAKRHSFSTPTPQEMAETETRAKKVKSPLYEKNFAIAFEFIRYYGYEKFVALSQFSNEHFVNDIHFNNIGNVNGSICLIDYGGYHSDIDYEE